MLLSRRETRSTLANSVSTATSRLSATPASRISFSSGEDSGSRTGIDQIPRRCSGPAITRGGSSSRGPPPPSAPSPRSAPCPSARSRCPRSTSRFSFTMVQVLADRDLGATPDQIPEQHQYHARARPPGRPRYVGDTRPHPVAERVRSSASSAKRRPSSTTRSDRRPRPRPRLDPARRARARSRSAGGEYVLAPDRRSALAIVAAAIRSGPIRGRASVPLPRAAYRPD